MARGMTMHNIVFVVVFVCLGPHLRHMVVPRLGVESELQLPARSEPELRPTPQLKATLDP